MYVRGNVRVREEKIKENGVKEGKFEKIKNGIKKKIRGDCWEMKRRE